MILFMEMIPGKLYKMRPGTGRVIWSGDSPETFAIGRANSGDIVVFIEETRKDERSGSVKVIVGEVVGYMVYGFSSMSNLLEPAEDEP